MYLSRVFIIAIATLVFCGGCISQKGRSVIELTLEAPEIVTDSIVNISAEVLMSRLTRYGIPDKSVTCEVVGSRIHFVIKGVDNPDRIKRLLTASGKLEFRATYETSEVITYLADVNDYLKTIPLDVAPEEKPVEGDDSDGQTLLEKLNDENAADSEFLSDEEFIRQNPLFGILRPNMGQDGQCMKGSVLGFASANDTARINGYLGLKDVRAILPGNIKFLWSRDPLRYSVPEGQYELYAIKAESTSGGPLLNESSIVNATSSAGPGGSDAYVMLSMNAEGADIWARVTRENIDRCIAIVLNDRVLSSPRVMQEITGGESQISGSFSLEDATDLAITLSSGVLPVELKIIEDKVKE